MAYRLYIQQDGSSIATDTLATYGVACQEFPFKRFPETKELPKRDWYDEDGEDVYMPADNLRMKAYDVEAKFIYSDSNSPARGSNVTKEQHMRNNIESFIKFICGRNENGKSLLKIYDEYTQTGRRGVYVLSVDNDLFFYNDTSLDAIAVFKVKFRVSDPVYDVAKTVNENVVTLT